jgi:peptide/nickel transport system permease protein
VTDTTVILTTPEQQSAGRVRRWAAPFARYRPRTISQSLGLIVVVMWIVLAIGASVFTSADPIGQNIPHRLEPPSVAHPFGTDTLGRDLLARILYGARVTVPIGVAIMVLTLVIGIPIGSLAAYVGGWVDEVLMRFADIFLAFPTLVLALAIAAALGPDLRSAVVAIAATLWPRYARVVRGQVLSVKQREFVLAARGLGAPPWRILLETILPNVVSVVAIVAIVDIGSVTLAGATLSFLGLGVAPPAPEWGAMVSDGITRPQLWWLTTFPGLALLSYVIGINLYGEVLETATPAAKKAKP